MARVRGDDELLELLGIMGGTVAEKDATMANDSPQINGNRSAETRYKKVSSPPSRIVLYGANVHSPVSFLFNKVSKGIQHPLSCP